MIYYKNQQLLIRSMLKSDIQKIIDNFMEQGWDKPYKIIKDYYDKQETSEKIVIIAELDGNIAGYVTLLPETKEGPFSNQSIPVIIDLIVFIKYQKKGIGNQIMDITENLAKKKADRVCLSVGLHHGYGSAQRMYIKRGYIPDGSGVWYKRNQLEQYTQCINDDSLTLHLIKFLK